MGSIADINEHIEGLEIEFDLMIREPEKTLGEWLSTSAERFIIHIESTMHIERCVDMIKTTGKKAGLALNNDTDLRNIESLISKIDFMQCMGIAEIGKQGNSFDERVLDRVKGLREKYPQLEISVDGSVNKDTIERVHATGATRLVSGSAIFGAKSPADAFCELRDMVL